VGDFAIDDDAVGDRNVTRELPVAGPIQDPAVADDKRFATASLIAIIIETNVGSEA
jgi:hypothetical protein